MVQKLARVSEIMTSNAIHLIDENATVEDAAKNMKVAKCGCLIVTGENGPVGIITERDLVWRVMAEGRLTRGTNVSEVMSKPVITVGSEALISDAATVMVQNHIRRLPIMDGGELVGIVTATDFAKYLHKKSESDPMLAVIARSNFP